MASCRDIDPLVTPYIDGEATAEERALVAAHISACPPCRQRADAEAYARATLRTRCCPPYAPEQLRKRCLKVATPMGRMTCGYSRSSLFAGAALVVMLGGVSVYALTRASPTVLAAELTLDHVKCFALHGGIVPVETQASENQFEQRYGWRLHVPQAPAADGLQLVGVRRCFCGEGTAVHVMYRHQGEPVSLFVLSDARHVSATTGAFGHDAVIWSNNNSTYVLIGKESSESLARLAVDLK